MPLVCSTRSSDRVCAIGLAVVTCGLLLVRFPNPYETVLALSVIVFCLLEIGRTLGSPGGPIVPGVAVVLISLKLFGLEVITYGLMLAAVAWVLMAYLWGPRRLTVGLASLVLFMLFLIAITYSDRSSILIGTLSAVPISLALFLAPIPPARLAAARCDVDRVTGHGTILSTRLALVCLFVDDPRGGCDQGHRASGPGPARPGGAGIGVPGRVP